MHKNLLKTSTEAPKASEISIVSFPKNEAHAWIQSLIKKRPSIAIFSLLSGDRWSCIDEIMIAKRGGEIVGILTLASKGETGDGIPTIVAVYVPPEFRGSGVPEKLIEESVYAFIKRGLSPIYIDVLSAKIDTILNNLPPELQQRIQKRVAITPLFASLLES